MDYWKSVVRIAGPVMFAVLALLALGFSGCAQPETVYVDRPVTVTATPPTPPTYLRFNLIFNQFGEPVTVQAQGFGLDSQGKQSYSGFSIRSYAVSTQVRNEYPNPIEWVPCKETMEGIRIKVLEGNDVIRDLIWSGIHCYGDSKQYALTIDPDADLSFGAYTGTPATPTAPAKVPTISFNKDSADRTLTVVQSEAADWSDIGVSATGCFFGQPESGRVQAGDVLRFGSEPETCTVYVYWRPTDDMIYETTFS